jgi:hypothetical protein
VAVTDPDRNARVAADAERLAQVIVDPRFRAQALASVARALATTIPAAPDSPADSA